ncbi:hypothetical protein EDD66_104152 [Mobilisporobacter senegalensis]|uniref:Uncharacterized protein n=1 Tax=Mobilisporobacter senegalensis TaxID=1329262 RepID=A0A3N1XPL7_9FIRM|nr:hypothetical protein [Mobilisporobacter senegalensis]ROR28566.1 hypothetical protein EDD66_104152 [Mobilisporobacter senegalensis]
MIKETKLDENAEIYKHRKTTVTEKQKLKNMTMKEKFQYFNDYYKTKTIVAGIAIVTSVSIMYTVLSPKPDTVLYAAIVNDSLGEDAKEQLITEFASLADIDLSSKEIILDSSYFISEENSNTSMASEQKLTTYIFAKDIDVIITDEKQFSKYANQGYFDNLSDHLPTDLYSDLSDSFYLANDSENNSINAYGIYLDKSKIYSQTGSIIDKPVIGIIANSKNKMYSVEFIRYLFGGLH